MLAKYENGNQHGKGTYSWANGDKYVGEYKCHKRHGLGTYTWANGTSWTGQ